MKKVYLILVIIWLLSFFKIFATSTGSCYINSSPQGAKVYLNNHYIGITPVFIKDIPVGSYNVTIVKSGYKTAYRTLYIKPELTTSISAYLTRVNVSGFLSVKSNIKAADVYVNNIYRGKTPIYLKFNKGIYKVSVYKKGYKKFVNYYRVKDGKTTYVYAKLYLLKKQVKGSDKSNKKNISNDKKQNQENVKKQGIDNNKKSQESKNKEVKNKENKKIREDNKELKNKKNEKNLNTKDKIKNKQQNTKSEKEHKKEKIDNSGNMNLPDIPVLYTLNVLCSENNAYYNSKLYINSEFKGLIPIIISLKPGKYDIKIYKENLPVIHKQIDINKNITLDIDKDIQVLKKNNKISIFSYKNVFFVFILLLIIIVILIILKLFVFKKKESVNYDSEKLDIIQNPTVAIDKTNFIPIKKEERKQKTNSWPIYRGDNLRSGLSKLKGPTKPSIIWHFETKGPIYSSPVIDDEGNIYFGSYDNNLYALSSDGSLNWKKEFADKISATALIKDDYLYIGSWDNRFYCLKKSDGSIIWDLKTDAPINSSAVLDNNFIFFGSDDGYLYKLNNQGKVVARAKTNSPIVSSPAIKNGIIYFANSEGNLYALTTSNLKLKWKIKLGSNISATISIDPLDDIIYIGTWAGSLFAIKDGEILWEYITLDDYNKPTPIYSSVAIGNLQTLYVGASNGVLYALNRDGSLKWQLKLASSITSSAIVDNKETIYIGTWDKKLYALFSGGTIKWNIQVNNSISSSPALANTGTLYFTSWDKRIYAVKD